MIFSELGFSYEAYFSLVYFSLLCLCIFGEIYPWSAAISAALELNVLNILNSFARPGTDIEKSSIS